MELFFINHALRQVVMVDVERFGSRTGAFAVVTVARTIVAHQGVSHHTLGPIADVGIRKVRVRRHVVSGQGRFSLAECVAKIVTTRLLKSVLC